MVLMSHVTHIGTIIGLMIRIYHLIHGKCPDFLLRQLTNVERAKNIIKLLSKR